MLPVFEQDVKNAFATALNQLAADPSILGASDDGEAERERLEAQLQSVKLRQSVLHDAHWRTGTRRGSGERRLRWTARRKTSSTPWQDWRKRTRLMTLEGLWSKEA